MIPTSIIQSSLSLLPAKMNSVEACVMMSAIGLQESEFIYRQQIGGPAHSFWMFEEGGLRCLMTNLATQDYVSDLCNHFGISFSVDSLYGAILTNDVLAGCLARLLLYSDPRPLPALGNGDDAWKCYLSNWRPGRPRPQDWPANYQAAMEAFRE